ncbi:MAG: mechanosensitive ion channel [gamma proteobacterium symbiont of Bathyaustriella thionipta]|nr:mechanosensitive ion channel [gamma proteobacterium symbiont of Bathyaustriella thionipta]MCU7950713.1 mechanosensitive ion channel [gamma proteobacterium symbiont of Bathyaustriella thionipta]MCU7953662.1 mechanosensitive ion channel [gamma proteobacterium symbiont of Bathyaustriella thionipta]MCU7957208.1 mechanosensitive ion channel [gamma proteobacterium symbiont of Bathyaustriella thionipta]MCU7967167.1 mechanosensitive ion channel [gamma proteobacterium symbiont of Bathyaustriella thio
MKFVYNIVLLLFLFCFSSIVFSVEPLHLVSENKLQEKIKSTEEAKNLDEESKNKLLDSYKNTLNFLESIKENNKKKDFYTASITDTPKKIGRLENKLSKLESTASKEKTPSDEILLKDIKSISLADLEQHAESQSIKLASLTSKNSDFAQSLNDLSQSLPVIKQNLINANASLNKKSDDKQLIPKNTSPDQKQAILWQIEAHIASLRSQIKMWDQQLLSQPVRLQLAKINKEISDYELKASKNQYELLQKKIELKRSQDIKKTQETIKAEQIQARGKHEIIQTLAESNTRLSEELSSKTKELNFLESRDDDVYKLSKDLSREQKNTKKKLDIAGLNQILGQVLYEQKKALPDPKRYKKNISKRQQLISKSGLDKLRYQEELDSIKHKEDYISRLLTKVEPETQKALYEDLMTLVNTRIDLLKKAIIIDEKYLKAVVEIDFAERQFIEVVNAYSDFLDEHLFWLRNAPTFNLQNLKNIPQQVVFFLEPSKWLLFIKDFVKMITTSYFILPVLIFISLFLFKKKRLNELLINTGLKTRRISKDSLVHTFKAFFYTLLMAAPLPILLYIISWQLFSLSDASEFTYSIALGMSFIILPLFCLQTFLYMCLPGGIAEVHFKWPVHIISGLKNEMLRLMITFLPAIFITALLISKGESSVNGGLGRIALILTLITFAVFFYRLVKPKSGLLHSIAVQHPGSFFAHYQALWFTIGLLVVSFLVGLTFTGYVYTAGQMTRSLILTVWLIFSMVILQQISIRWLLLTQRRYALKMALEKRKALLEKKLQDNEHETPEHGIEFEEPEIDMVSLSEESSKLLNLVLFILALVGLSAIWSEVLPALSVFDKFVLWHYNGIVEGTEQILPVTLWDLVIAVFVIVLTIVGAKRLPAIIEILLLQSSSISSGSLYTITTLVNYTIIGLGVFTIFNMLGAEWAKLQWLFAALSVGIGFGLQEIVANFISGIIILFERPIRVGDYVSVGENEGVVSKIQIRATTIMTKDRKELLVPNKEFITGQLLNWSLSDPTARLIIPVGVAYGSDVPLARKLLLEAAEENESVLDDPVPQVLFFNFGNNTLDLQLRCFIGHVDIRRRVTSEINEAINNKFNAAEINIAFPQRDVHLDIKQPIDIVLNKKD